MSNCVVRAFYSEQSIRVYQAYSPAIAKPALAAGRFVPPFKVERMTWIKPSFNWMMYRCGYASKAGQEMVLGIDITREGFEWALRHAALSRYLPSHHTSHDDWRRELETKSVRVQWDPERNWRLEPIEGVRSIQIGLSGEAVRRYVNEWILRIEDVTAVAHAIGAAVDSSGVPPRGLPSEREQPYLLDPALAGAICLH
jgi:hypothetical protein